MGGLGGFVSNLFGSDNTFRASPTKLDPNAYMYGGTPGGAQAQQDRSAGLAGTYGSAAYTGIQNSLGARQGQADYINQLKQQAAGLGPSAAQGQLQQATNAANEGAASFANSARGGPLAQAAAQRQAQGQVANNLQTAGAQSAVLKAQEQNAATAALGGALGQQRQQDLGLAGLGAGAQAGYEGQRVQVGEDQLNARMRGQAQQSENDTAANQINANLTNQQADRDQGNGELGLGAIAGAAGAIAMSDARLKMGIHPLQSEATPSEQSAAGRFTPMSVGFADARMSTGPAMGTRDAGGAVLGHAPASLADHARAILASDFYLKNQVTPLAQGHNGAPIGAMPMYAPLAPLHADHMGGPQLSAAPSSTNTSRMMWSDEGLKSGIEPLGMNNASFATNGPSSGSDLQNYKPGVSADAPAAGKNPLASLGGGGGGKSKLDEGMSAGSAIGGAIGKLGGLLSDRRLKTDVAPTEPQTDDFMSHLHGYGYHYKQGVPGEDPSQQRYGIIAQQVASSPMGASIVDKTPIGLAIDVPHAIGPIMAAEGDLYRKHLEDAKNIALLKKQVRR